MYDDKRDKAREDVIVGRNAVYEALRAGRLVDSVLIARGNTGGPVERIVELCRRRGVVIKDTAAAKLDAMCGGMNHQGVAAVAAAHEYGTVEEMLAEAARRGEPPLLVICDEVNDPHNLGAIIRTAECCGAHGVIIPKRGGVGLTAAVDKAACGALEYIPVARVANLVATAKELKKQGVWVYGTDMNGQPFYQTDFSGAAAVVVGSEGKGMSRLLRETCDAVVSIPMRGKISSLNASVAAGVVLYEAARARLKGE